MEVQLEALSLYLPCFRCTRCSGWPTSSHYPKHSLSAHAFFNLFLPPYLGISLQYLQTSQLALRQFRQAPHLLFLFPIVGGGGSCTVCTPAAVCLLLYRLVRNTLPPLLWISDLNVGTTSCSASASLVGLALTFFWVQGRVVLGSFFCKSIA